MRSKIFLALLLFGFAVVPRPYAAAQNAAQPNADMAAELLKLVNTYRVGKGLDTLKTNFFVMRAAQKHSNDMATQKVPFGHDGFDSRMDKIAGQVHPANAFAENVAFGANTAKEAMDMWLNSEGHRQNIEGKYSITGIGIVKGTDGNLYFTEIFVYQKK